AGGARSPSRPRRDGAALGSGRARPRPRAGDPVRDRRRQGAPEGDPQRLRPGAGAALSAAQGTPRDLASARARPPDRTATAAAGVRPRPDGCRRNGGFRRSPGAAPSPRSSSRPNTTALAAVPPPPLTPRPRRPLSSQRSNAHTGTAVTKFHGDRDILVDAPFS